MACQRKHTKLCIKLTLKIYLASKQKSVKTKTRRSSGFRNLLWEFNVSEIESKTSQIMQDNDIHHLYKEGFNNLRAGFEEFLIENEINYDSNESGYFKIYSNVDSLLS